MSDIEKRIKELEEKVEKLEQGKKPYIDEYGEIINPYDLSQVAKLRGL